MARFSPIEYIRQVRAEARKVTWPTRRETWMSVVAVFVMVTLASLFLFTADQILAWLVRTVIGLGM